MHRLLPRTNRTLISKSIWEYNSGRAWVSARLFFSTVVVLRFRTQPNDMKRCLSISSAMAMLLMGCGQDSNKPAGGSTNASGSSGSVLTAPVDYLRAAGNAQKSAIKTVDTASINRAIQMFNVEKGRNPKDLNELVQEKFMPQIPPAPAGMK